MCVVGAALARVRAATRASLCAVVGGLRCVRCGCGLRMVHEKAELVGSSAEKRKTTVPIPLVHVAVVASKVCELL